MLRPDDIESWMLQLADIAGTDPHNQVFVMREVLTKAYTHGFEDGLHAADRDAFVRRQIAEKAKATDGGDGHV